MVEKMAKQIKNTKIKAPKLRTEWPAGVKPYTRVEPDKTKFNRKEKHKKSPEDDFSDNK